MIDFPKHPVIDLDIDRLEVVLDLKWFIEGNGIIKELKAQGIRGSIDRFDSIKTQTFLISFQKEPWKKYC